MKEKKFRKEKGKKNTRAGKGKRKRRRADEGVRNEKMKNGG